MNNKEKERIMNLSMRYCTAFLGGMAVNTSVLSKVLDELFTNKQVIAMSLDKAIEHGKEKRKPYYGAQAIDCTCRPHGSCEWCRRNRMYQQLKMEEASRQALEESEEEECNTY